MTQEGPPASAVDKPLDSRAVIGGGGFGGIGSPRELIGHGTDANGTSAVLDRCLELGVTVIDTAYSYAGGESHRFIGRWLAVDPTRRAQVAIADKVGIVDGPEGLVTDLSPESVLRCAEEGRARLGVESVDVVMTHGPDRGTPIPRTLTAFARLLEDGSARYWGVSNVEADDLRTWLDEADRLGVPAPYVVENELSLLVRGDEQAVLPLCREHGIRYYAFSPLASSPRNCALGGGPSRTATAAPPANSARSSAFRSSSERETTTAARWPYRCKRSAGVTGAEPNSLSVS